jgi:hypothetical protein
MTHQAGGFRARTEPRVQRARAGTRGQIFLLVAMGSTAIFGFAGLAIDGSMDQADQLLSQGAADASGVSAARIWAGEITAHSYTAAPPYNSGCAANSVCSGASHDNAVFEAGQIARLNNMPNLVLDTVCMISQGNATGTDSTKSLHLAFYSVTPTNANCPTIPAGSTFQRVDVFIPPRTPPAACVPTWRCVEVNVERHPAQNFFGVLGRNTITVSGASSVFAPTGILTLPCGACSLGTTGTTISVIGSAQLTVNGAPILSNSTSASALVETGTGVIKSTGSGAAIETPGNMSCSDPSKCIPSPVVAGSSPDPYSAVPYPAVGGSSAGAFNCVTACTITPGIYTDFSASGNAVVTMGPGVYVFTGLFQALGSSTVNGTGALLYFTCAGYTNVNPSPCAAGSAPSATCAGQTQGVYVSGSAQLNLTPPSSGAYNGMGVFYDRDLSAPICISGTAAPKMGTVYAADGDLIVAGTGGTQSAVVTAGILLSGTATLTIDASVAGVPAPVNNGTTATTLAEIAR